MGRVTDVTETVNQAIRYVKSNPCCLCSYENARTHECRAGVKYKGTCKVYRTLKCKMHSIQEIEE